MVTSAGLNNIPNVSANLITRRNDRNNKAAQNNSASYTGSQSLSFKGGTNQATKGVFGKIKSALATPFAKAGDWVSNKAVNSISKGGKINDIDKAPWIVKTAEKNGMLISSIIAFGLGTTLRPATIMAMPGNKEDNKYAAVKSMATGIVSLCFVGATLMVLGQNLKKSGNLLYKNLIDKDIKTGKLSKDLGERFKSLVPSAKNGKFLPEEATKVNGQLFTEAENKLIKKYETKAEIYNKLTNYTSKWIIGPIEAASLFALMPKIMNVLGIKKGKSSKPQTDKPTEKQEANKSTKDVKAESTSPSKSSTEPKKETERASKKEIQLTAQKGDK